MNEVNIQENHVNLLWTGGWDSTFQLLQLLLIYKCSVSPFYLIHEDRPSTGIEIKTMKNIKTYIFEKFPHTKKLLSSTQYYALCDILPNKEITSAYESIIKNTPIGIQYDWLARLCIEKNIQDLQMSIEKPIIYKENDWETIFDSMLYEDVIHTQTVYRFDPKYKNSNIYKIFKHFVFPVRNITKVEMNEIAIENGWEKVMNMTWFCHKPTFKMTPCGICKPCIQAIDSGMGWRIPPGQRALSLYYRKIYWPTKAVIRSTLIKLGLYSEKKDRYTLNV